MSDSHGVTPPCPISAVRYSPGVPAGLLPASSVSISSSALDGRGDPGPRTDRQLLRDLSIDPERLAVELVLFYVVVEPEDAAGTQGPPTGTPACTCSGCRWGCGPYPSSRSRTTASSARRRRRPDASLHANRSNRITLVRLLSHDSTDSQRLETTDPPKKGPVR